MEVINQNAWNDAALCRLYVCGCRGSRPVSGRQFLEFGGQTSCYILRTGNHGVVIDCGTGLYDAQSILADCKTVDILITHMHYDHILGLLTTQMLPKNARIRIFGNFEAWFGKISLEDLYRPPFWPVNMMPGSLIQWAPDGVCRELEPRIRAALYPADHPNDCNLIYLEAAGKRICVFADCEHSAGMPEERLQGCDILLYDGMFDSLQQVAHPGWGHSSWEEGCELAKRCRPRLLLITHHDPQNPDDLLREWEKQAQLRYPDTRFARAGDQWVL